MTGHTPFKQSATTPVALHPLSQVNFRLSQRPPSSQKRSRRSFIDRTDSIEDDDSECSQLIPTADSVFTDEPSTPLTMSSPMLSLSSTYTQHGTATQASQLERSDVAGRMPLSCLGSNIGTPLSMSGRKSIGPLSCSPASVSCTPMRRVSIYQQAISGSPASTGSGGGVLRRPLSSQRPPSSAGAGGFADALLQAYRTPTGSNATQSHEGPLQSTTPTKRAKRDGAAMTEFRRAVAREMSEYNMWWHCMQDDTTASSLVCSRPAESIRVVLTGIKPLVPLTLYHGSAEVEQVTGFLDKPVGVGQTVSLLLSLAACTDCTPRVAREMTACFDRAAETEDSLALCVYRPWRTCRNGSEMSILVSRFVIARDEG